LDLRDRVGNAHGVLGIVKKEFLFMVQVNVLDFFHQILVSGRGMELGFQVIFDGFGKF